MPIRESERSRYPKDWPQISQRVRARAGWCCQFCGVKNGALGGRIGAKFHPARPTGDDGLRLTWPRPGDYAWCEGAHVQLRIIRIVLTVAHLDHKPENCADDNLRALCQRCHLTYDAKHHRRNAAATRRAARASGDLFG